MGFKEQLTADLEEFFNTDEFAEGVVYISQSGGTINIDSIVFYLDNLHPDGHGNYRDAIIYVKKDDLNFEYMDKVWIKSIEWKIIRASEEDDQIIKIQIQRDERIAL